MVRGRTTAEKGLVLGHEITGEVIELGRDVEFIKKGDIVSVPLMLLRSAVKIVKRFDRYLFKCKMAIVLVLTDMCGYGCY
jgi:glutathione-independent formaldehyde dehydrogenase